MAESNKKEELTKKNHKFGGLIELLTAYDKLEELTAKLMELNITQLDGRIEKKQANDELYKLADEYCDLSQEIMDCKKAMLADAKSAYVQNQKGE